ncbi:type II secretion system protein GspM [Kordiimonas sp.]|uniref:type II secretion system protein GspM n=1 Tax=Kordiimonas sp. TaxID=1970157 RepID=UPI003A92B8D2
MKDYWNGLTAREQALLLLMAVLTTLVLLWLSVVRPLQASHETALRERAAALDLYSVVATAAAEARGLKAAGQQAGTKASNEPLRVAVAVTARAAGVSISRIQPGEDSTITIWADEVVSASLYRWLTTLANDRQITPVKVSVQKAGDGRTLRAQVQFEEAG